MRKYIEEIKKNLLVQNHWANFNQIGTMHPWVKGMQVCSNEGPLENTLTKFKNLKFVQMKGSTLFPRGDN